MTAFPSYATGTVSVNNGDTAIVGVSTIWSGVNARPGDIIIVNGLAPVEIKDVTDVTHLALWSAWAGGTQAAVSYTIIQKSPLRFAGGQAMADVSSLVAALNTDGFYVFVGPMLSVPDPSYGNDNQFAFQPSTSKLWLKTGGTWVFQGIFKGLNITGAWSSATAYNLNDVVSLAGSSYVATAAGTNHTPPNVSFWAVLAAIGATGSTGATGAGYGGSSTTSLLIAIASKVFTTQAGLAYQVGGYVRASSAANGANYMEGFITAYSSTTLTINVTRIGGSGTLADWNFASAGAPGSGDLLSTNNLSDLTNKVLARANIYAAAFDALAYSGLQVNGSCDVSQFNATTAVALTSGTPAYILDSWVALLNRSATLAISCQQIAPPGSPSFQSAFQGCIQMKATTGLASLAAGDYAFIEALIEGYRAQRLGFGQSNAQSVTIGFWVYATISGTATLCLSNNAINRTYLANFTVSSAATWQYVTITIPGDTTGTWEFSNLIGLCVRFCFGVGASNQGTNAAWNASGPVGTSATTNFFASTNNVVCVTGLVVVPGTEAPSSARSPFIMRPFDQELWTSQRYYAKSFAVGTVPANNIVGDEYAGFAFNTAGMNSQRIYYPTKMRTSPAMSFFSSNNKASPTANQWQYFNGSAWVDITSMAIANSGADINDNSFVAALLATVTAQAAYIIGGGWTANARL